MNSCLECLPCLGKNAVDAAKRSTKDPVLQKRILADSFRLLAENDYSMPPSHTAREILDIAFRHTGQADIYKEEKHQSNRLAEKLVSELPKLPEYHGDSFESRLRLAIAGNILDFGIFADLDLSQAMKAVRSALVRPLDPAAVTRLKEKMDSAKRILYVLDNCGEAVFDRIFMEPYREKIILGVRGRPAFNDVTASDLAECGLSGWPTVDNGPVGVPGTILTECSDTFRKVFDEADLIVAKGQGNFETMNEYKRPIAFLFLVKCPVVTRLLGAEMNSVQIRLVNL